MLTSRRLRMIFFLPVLSFWVAQVQIRWAGAQEDKKLQPIGQKPVEEADIRKIFLRQTSVLLHPGQVEFEASPGYIRNQSSSLVLNVKFRQFRMPLAARFGLFRRAEAYLTVPAVYVHREMSFADQAITYRQSGIGDATIGLNYEVTRENISRPDTIAFFSVTAPTGSKPNEAGVSLGSGHWAVNAGVQFIKTVDPIALFGGILYSHQFPARYFLNEAVHSVKPGETAGYNFGFGFAVNDNVSLSAQVTGSYQARAKADEKPVFGSSSEPVTLRWGLTYRYSRRTYIEPSVVIGLDDDASDFALGISFTHRLGK